MRKPIIAGNWKMNCTPNHAELLVKELIPLAKNSKAEIIICPPFVCLERVQNLIKDTNIRLGAQNFHFEEKGAFTGEIAANMLKELGVSYVIIGHSERRSYFAETDETVNKKVKRAIQEGLIPIICVGESLAQREQGITNEWIAMQVKLALQGVSQEQVSNVVIAYEPIWAIGTGKTATATEANATISAIRDTLERLYGAVAKEIRILYGGSMNAKNASELMKEKEIDGGLIGGASLKAEDFARIIHYEG